MLTGDFTAEQYQRNFHFLFYGLATAWLVLLAFVAALAARERKLRSEVERLRAIIDDRTREVH
jgi:hypothetical protein